MLVEVLSDVLLVQNVRDQSHCDEGLWQLGQPLGLLSTSDFKQITEEAVEHIEFFLSE